MGKKNKKSKKIKNFWDLTAEEQEMQADKLYELELGRIDILDLANIKPILNDNGLSAGIEDLIVKDLTRREDEVVSLNGGRTNMEILTGNKPVQENYREEVNKPKANVALGNTECRKVSFKLGAVKDLYRLVVDDGISPTSYSIIMGLKQELDGTYDADDVFAKCETLFDYIITLKYPTAVYEVKDFLNEEKYNFTRVAADKYDTNKFKFVEANGYLLCYIVDDESVIKMKEMFDTFEYDDADLLKTYVSLAYTCGSVMQAFFIEDKWYIDEFANSKFNQKKAFHDAFTSDDNTEILPENVEVKEGEDGVYVSNAEYLHKEARDVIETVTGEEYFEDDEDDDEEEELFDSDDENSDEDDTDTEEEAVEEVVVEKKEKVTAKTITKLEVTQATITETTTEEVEEDSDDEEEEDDYDDLLSEEMVVVEKKEVTKIEPSNDDEFKIQVVRRK